MKKYLTLGCFLIGMTCQAQIKDFSIYASVNCPIIKDVETEQQTIPIPIPPATGYSSFVATAGLRESFTSKIGFEIGGRFDYSITPKFFLTSGLAFGYVRFQRTVEITHLSSDIQLQSNTVPTTVGVPYGALYGSFSWRDAQGNVILHPPAFPERSENIGNTTTLSAQAPLLAGTSFLKKRLEVSAGAIFSYLLHATQVRDEYVPSTQSFSEHKDSSKAGFNEFQWGVTVQTTYLLGRHVGINFAAQKFFSTIYNSKEQPGSEGKYNILSLGFSYLL